jgi:hypothetical protein
MLYAHINHEDRGETMTRTVPEQKSRETGMAETARTVLTIVESNGCHYPTEQLQGNSCMMASRNALLCQIARMIVALVREAVDPGAMVAPPDVDIITGRSHA